MGELEGRVALVTGAGRGIGRSIALRFAAAGARVAALARTKAEIEAVAAEGGGAVRAVPADVAQDASVEAALRAVQEALGPVDILVNNAAVFLHKPVIETTPEEWMRLYDVNVLGAVRLTRAVLPEMLRRRAGRIINICSTASHRGYGMQSAYVASKHALLGFTKVLAEETRNTGVRVHAISPGGVNTTLVRVRKDINHSEYMDPAEIAEIALFLAKSEGLAVMDEVVVRRSGAEPFR